jgi:flagellar hook-basal body complex protein FliE
MQIHNLGINNQLAQGTTLPKGSAETGDDFAHTLMDVLKEVNNSQNNSADMQKAYMTGQPVEYHDLMIAMEKANTSLQLTMQVRNKLLDAYQEISKLQI